MTNLSDLLIGLSVIAHPLDDFQDAWVGVKDGVSEMEVLESQE
jgi:hypothetical protein